MIRNGQIQNKWKEGKRAICSSSARYSSSADQKLRIKRPLSQQNQTIPQNTGFREGETPRPRTTGDDLQEAAAKTKQFQPLVTIAEQLRKRASTATETYTAYGACEKLIKECARQAQYNIPEEQRKKVYIPKPEDGEDIGRGQGWWYNSRCSLFMGSSCSLSLITALGLPPTFSTWAQVSFLHMYMLTCRFRMFQPKIAPTWHQHLLNHFFYLAEERMTEQHGIVTNAVRTRYLKDLFVQWRGLVAGYDEGVAKGDAVLATAVWRNLFNAANDVDFRGVAQVVGYMRLVLSTLEGLEYERFESAAIVFRDPTTMKELAESADTPIAR